MFYTVVARTAPLVGQGSLGLHAAMELLRTNALFRVMNEDFFHAVMTRLTSELRKALKAAIRWPFCCWHQEEGGEVLEWLEQTGTSLAGGYGEADVGLQELMMVLTGLLKVRWRNDSIRSDKRHG
ncbi:unnamed protein product [Vitrella brassicaformis CCMP3155]|uniref:Uncharacterized protein n=1 Tax=Vitrella brassicaformis (strain CCMP3155) TaxID=1169540 RepID=A0A0G4F4G5_VITBC|nr:unnamed protein product [Vitrella brassicaformis CCMP3155]|eukprot:CEM06768.1 unnamed protein product [Vitrella brassicaformis CCMP3155]